MTHPLTGHPADCACDRCGQPAPTYLAIAMENRDLRERLESAEAALREEAECEGCDGMGEVNQICEEPDGSEGERTFDCDECDGTGLRDRARAHFARYAEKKEKKT